MVRGFSFSKLMFVFFSTKVWVFESLFKVDAEILNAWFWFLCYCAGPEELDLCNSLHFSIRRHLANDFFESPSTDKNFLNWDQVCPESFQNPLNFLGRDQELGAKNFDSRWSASTTKRAPARHPSYGLISNFSLLSSIKAFAEDIPNWTRYAGRKSNKLTWQVLLCRFMSRLRQQAPS